MFDGVKRIASIHTLMKPYFRGTDAQTDYAQSAECYEWYYSYAQARQPRTVLEIGVYRGYSVIAMLLGYPSIQELYLVDDGSYGTSIESAAVNIRQLFFAPGTMHLFPFDTQRTSTVWFDSLMELIHVDGDHSPTGLYHDLGLVLPWLAPDGWIIVDDVTMIPQLFSVCQTFAYENRLALQFVPTYRGHVILTQFEIRPLTTGG